MNYLAHLYLSGNNDYIKIGNFIGDGVKGNIYNKYSQKVRFGILLHRKIDSYTDKHDLVKQCSKKFKPAYGKFSGAVIDMLFDHFLASDWNKYSNEPLPIFAKKTYILLEKNMEIMPEKTRRFSHFFIKRDRLNCYANLKCFEDVLFKMGVFTSLPIKSKQAMLIINKHYDSFYTNFILFFEELQDYVNKIMLLKNETPATIIKY